MLDIALAVTQKYPALAKQPTLIRQPALGLLRRLTHEVEINHHARTGTSA